MGSKEGYQLSLYHLATSINQLHGELQIIGLLVESGEICTRLLHCHQRIL